MISKASILSKILADFIVQLRIQELQNISHKQPLKLSKLYSVFLDIPFNLSNVTCDPPGNKTSGMKIVRFTG